VRYKVIEGGLVYSEITRDNYPFHFAIIDNPEGVAIWLKQKIYWELLSRNATLIVLSPYLDYNRDMFRVLETSNWLTYVCEYALVKEIYVVLPKYLKDYPEWKSSLQSIAKEAREVYNDPVNLLDKLSDLPKGEELGSVILVIDIPFFSNSKFPSCIPELEEIIFQLNSVINTLKEKRINLEALVIVESPEFSYNEHIRKIEEQLLEMFRSK